MTDIFGTTWGRAQVEVMELLRDWAVGFVELNHHLGAWMDLPTTDANALGQILWADTDGAPLSPARLGQRIGMTSGATTVLINRLESAGMIARSREHSDRRRVTLRPTPAARERARAFSEAASDEMAAALKALPAASLDTSISVLRQMVHAATAANDRLRERPPRPLDLAERSTPLG